MYITDIIDINMLLLIIGWFQRNFRVNIRIVNRIIMFYLLEGNIPGENV